MNQTHEAWIVSVADDALPEIDTLAAHVRELGADVDRVLGLTGIIRCSCPEHTAELIRAIGGVSAVEHEAVAETSEDRLAKDRMA